MMIVLLFWWWVLLAAVAVEVVHGVDRDFVPVDVRAAVRGAHDRFLFL
jgi:hypothetical protein